MIEDITDGDVEAFKRELYSELDGLESDDVARRWALSLSAPGGSREAGFIYSVYVRDQPTKRKEEIRDRFGHYITQEGQLELEEGIE